MKLRVILFISSYLLSSFAYSFDLTGQEIDVIGAHDGQTMFLTLKSGELNANQCLYSIVYCPVTNPECKAMLSIALTAKTTKSLVSLGINKNADNSCTLWKIAF